MAKAKLRLNPNLQAQVERMVAPKLEAYQKELNQVLQAQGGKPVEEIHQALIEVTRRHGIKPKVGELRKLAQQHAG